MTSSLDERAQVRLDAMVVRLRGDRRAAGISQFRLASLIGVEQASLAAWEGGKRSPSDGHLHLWAALLGTAVPAGVEGWKAPECGTQPGRRRHLYLREEPCEPCRAAHRQYERSRT